MLTLDKESKSAVDYDVLNSSIKDTFTAIDRFECFAIDEILLMREEKIYLQAGYKNFKQYCQSELSAWGGYRRINQLLGAKKVIVAAEELGQHIKNERQSRPLLRLVKVPEKLKLAISQAIDSNPSPSESDFAAAAKKVAPNLRRKKQSTLSPMVGKIEEPLVPKKAQVTVSSPSHPRYGESGVIYADPPNRSQQIVTFADGERMLINNADLNHAIVTFSNSPTSPKEYSEAICSLKQQHKIELERLEKDLRIGLL
ncbi:hypothetical protein LC605_01495, partial [Nostoc sp. CHAB 5836]|nr:hypothetical protein [Nostoc sp. CHAB 5836]